MKGYYKRPDVARQCIDQQGWFHSGACSVVYMGTSFLDPRIYTRVVSWYLIRLQWNIFTVSYTCTYVYVHHICMYWPKINWNFEIRICLIS